MRIYDCKKILLFHYRGRIRGTQQANADLILGKDQLYDMFQQILSVKKFEHQIIFNALQVHRHNAFNFSSLVLLAFVAGMHIRDRLCALFDQFYL